MDLVRGGTDVLCLDLFYTAYVKPFLLVLEPLVVDMALPICNYRELLPFPLLMLIMESISTRFGLFLVL